MILHSFAVVALGGIEPEELLQELVVAFSPAVTDSYDHNLKTRTHDCSPLSRSHWIILAGPNFQRGWL